MNRTKLIQDELKALWWFSANIHKDVWTNLLTPVTKSGALLLPELHKTHGKLYWTRGAAEVEEGRWEDGRRAEVYWEVGERGLVVFSGPMLGTADCCLRR